MARVTLTPVNHAGAKGLVIGATGVQALTGFTGVQFIPTPFMHLMVYNGAGSQTITQLIGGQVQGVAPTVAALALTASTNTDFGPWSVTDYTQRDGSGMQYIDFGGTVANLSVTLYQCVPAN
jgi:hypothetical protein